MQDFVPILIADGPDAGTDPDVVDAPGNIGDGTRWSVGFRATLPLENIGLPGARLDASLAGGAEVTDPVTFETRDSRRVQGELLRQLPARPAGAQVFPTA